MKYVLIILDGAADEPLPELDGRTPLMAAAMPRVREMLRRGRVGAARHLPFEWAGDAEAALLSVFGYDPAAGWPNRGPLEAASLQVSLDHNDLAFRCNLIHTDGVRMLDPTAGRIPHRDASTLIQYLEETLRARQIQFYPGSGYRNVMVWREGPAELLCRPPQEIVGEPIRAHRPEGERAVRLHEIMNDSFEILSEHPINRRRRDEGLSPATMIWPWSPGRLVRLDSFSFRHGLGGAVVAGTHLVRGLARSVGLRPLNVPGATGYLDTDYTAKARAALDILAEINFVAIHVDAPNEASLDGDYEAKVDALERIDERLIGTILDRIGRLDDFRIMVAVDHPSFVKQRRAGNDWVPFLLTGNKMKAPRNHFPFDERAADESDWRFEDGTQMLTELFAGDED